MKKILLLILLPLLTGCVVQDNAVKLVKAAKESAAQNINYFLVVNVVDGDTIDIDYFGKRERLRMIGINTPESVDPRRPAECFGKEAAAQGKQLLTGKLVRIEPDPTQADRDKFGRLLRYVTTKEGLFYNLEIIRQGYAYEYTYQAAYKHQARFKAAQQEASDQKLGLWSDNACGKNGARTDADEAPSSVVAGKCLIKGNINMNKDKIYHLPGCGSYAETSINPGSGERWFCTEAEAKQAGFKKAGNCI